MKKLLVILCLATTLLSASERRVSESSASQDRRIMQQNSRLGFIVRYDGTGQIKIAGFSDPVSFTTSPSGTRRAQGFANHPVPEEMDRRVTAAVKLAIKSRSRSKSSE